MSKSAILTNTVRVSAGDPDGKRRIFSTAIPWFKGTEYVVLSYTGSALHIKKCYWEVPNKASKVCESVNHFSFSKRNIEIPLGDYVPDDNFSNEDELILTLKKINL